MEVAVVCCGNSPGLPRGSSLYCVSKGCLRCSCYWVLALPYSRLLLWFRFQHGGFVLRRDIQMEQYAKNDSEYTSHRTGRWRILYPALAFFIMLRMFGSSTMKELNLLTINLLAAFMDACYRLFLQIFGIYKRPWMSYPLNVLFASTVFSDSLILAKHIIPVQIYSKTKLLKVTSVLALQFVTGIPVRFLLVSHFSMHMV